MGRAIREQGGRKAFEAFRRRWHELEWREVVARAQEATHSRPLRRGFKYDAFGKASISMDAKIGESNTAVSDLMADESQNALDRMVEAEKLEAIAQRLVRERGLTLEAAHELIRRML